jgi:hypothetical protein
MAQDKKTHTDKDAASSELARKFKSNPALFIGTVVVLVLIIVSFVLVPAIVPESTRGFGDLTFGYYDKVPVSFVQGNAFAQYYEEISNQYRNVDADPGQVQMQIWMQAFEAAALHTAILQEVKKSNYSVPEKIVNSEIAKQPEFQDNGRFSSALYRQRSDSERLSLWRQMQERLASAMYFDDFLGILTPSGEANFIGKMSSGMRSFKMVSFMVDDYPSSEYSAFAEENADLFRTIHLSRITVNSSEKEAKKILASIKSGTFTFEEAAMAQSQDGFADRGGDMGIRYAFDIEREIASSAAREKIFSLERGELSDVISLNAGWAFFRVEDELRQADFRDAAVMERVRSYIRNYQRGLMEDWAIAQARDFIADAKALGFDYAADLRNKEKHEFGPLPINYGNEDIFSASLEYFSIPEFSRQELLEMSRNLNFWKVAFSTPIDTPCEPLVQGNKVLVLLPVEQVDLEEDRIEGIASYYSYSWLRSAMLQSLQPYFMNSSKMDNRFWDAYYRNILSPGR